MALPAETGSEVAPSPGRRNRWPASSSSAWPHHLIALIFGLLTLGLSLYQTQVRRIGIANNNDFDRLANHVGLRTARPPIYPQAWPDFAYVRGHTPSRGGYWSSLDPVINAFAHVATWFSNGRFDLRWLGMAYSICFAIAVYLLCLSFESKVTQIVFGGLIVIVLCDANLVAYFNSLYDEPWTLLLVLIGLVTILRIRGRTRLPGVAIVGLAALSILLLTSKSQNAFLGLIFAAALLSLRSGKPNAAGWRQRVVPFACAGLVLVSIPLYLSRQAPVYSQENLYDAVFQELLGHSKDPAADLRWLHLPASWANLKGSNAFWVDTQIKSPEFQRFVKHGRTKLGEFYVTHPDRAARALLRGTRYGMKAHIFYLGYKENDGHTPPLSGPCGFCPVSSFTQSVSSQGPVIILGLYAASLGIALAWRRRGGVGASNAMFFLLAVSAYSLLVAVFGEGLYEETKHLYLFYCCNALLAVFAVAGCVQLIRRRSTPDAAPEATPHPPEGGVKLGEPLAGRTTEVSTADR